MYDVVGCVGGRVGGRELSEVKVNGVRCCHLEGGICSKRYFSEGMARSMRMDRSAF